jgi:hypothetical protein
MWVITIITISVKLKNLALYSHEVILMKISCNYEWDDDKEYECRQIVDTATLNNVLCLR